jgi:signal peptidase I
MLSNVANGETKKRIPGRDLLSLGVMVAVLLMARSSLADHYQVPSGSMQPTVDIGDRVLVLKAAYGLRLPFSDLYLGGMRTPARGDVVVLESPEDGRVLLKRVVAVAGDEVAVRGGRLFLDGRAVPVDDQAGNLTEHLGSPHTVAIDLGGGPDLLPTRVPAGKLLVVGDNRGNSHDGRSFGFVPAESVLGRAFAVYARDGDLTWIDL